MNAKKFTVKRDIKIAETLPKRFYKDPEILREVKEITIHHFHRLISESLNK